MSSIQIVKDYLDIIKGLGVVAYLYIGVIVGTFLLFIVYDEIGYSARIKRGSKAVIAFYRKRGWVDNSNISLFITRCIRRYPYAVRANFSLYTSSDNHLEQYLNERQNLSREFSARAKVIKTLFDLVIGISGLIALIYLAVVKGFETIYLAPFVVVGYILRNILMSGVLLREISSKNYYLRALDLMYNGIFLPKKSVVYDNHIEEIANEDEDLEVMDATKEIKERINTAVNDCQSTNDDIPDNIVDTSQLVVGDVVEG